MDWIESLKYIRKAQENNQLVIFVGAGVSANSNIPSWKNLVREIAEEIKYCRCTSCASRGSESCIPEKCSSKYDFTSEELIRIPEYFFQMDNSEEHKHYFETIKRILQADQQSNPIDEEILLILPHHIITTNFDHLLENTSSINKTFYTVVSDDKSLISNSNEKYIIKMHGDIDTPQSIVLKESDYLNYEQEHPLISTFIRSLLINHTFLFVGYGLNDYNLNLIISWINYFRSVHKANNPPYSFLVTDKETSRFEADRLEQKQIISVGLDSISEDLIDHTDIPKELTNPIGKKLYIFLHAINAPEIMEQSIPLSELFREKIDVFSSYRRISFHDLTSTYSIGRSEMSGTELILYDKKWYSALETLLDEKHLDITNIFQRAGITAIQCFKSRQRHPIISESETDSILSLELSNNYLEIKNRLSQNLILEPDKSIYWHKFFRESIPKVLFAKDEQNARQKDYVGILLYKLRLRLSLLSPFANFQSLSNEISAIFKILPNRYQQATKFLHRFFDSTSEDYLIMEKLLRKQEERYQLQSNRWESGPASVYIKKLQSYAYDYYYFMKCNALPIDSFREPKDYLKYYLQSILCSYSPILEKTQMDYFGFFKTDLKKYPLNEIDLDILVKYSDPKTLLSWVDKYSVKKLLIDKAVDIEQKFVNLCRCYIYFDGKNFQLKIADYLFSMVIIVSLLNDTSLFESSLRHFSETIRIMASSSPNSILKIMEPLFFLIKSIPQEECRTEKENLLESFVLSPIIDAILKDSPGSLPRNNYDKILKRLLPFRTDAITTAVIQYVDTLHNDIDKCNSIYRLRTLLPNNHFSQYLCNNLSQFTPQNLFYLITDHALEFSSKLQDYWLDYTQREYLQQKDETQIGISTNPDTLLEAIEFAILLKLVGYPIDISCFDKFKDVSAFLAFVLEPNTFDYSQIDTGYYMWQNLIFSPEYQHFFVEHRKDILSDNLHALFSGKKATESQKKIVYGILLEKDELSDW